MEIKIKLIKVLYLYIFDDFVQRKCWILTFKVRYTFFAGHPVEIFMVKYGDISSYYEAFIAFSSIFIWKSLKGQLSGTHWYGGPHLPGSHSCKVWFKYISLLIYYSSYNSCFIAMILLMLLFLGVTPSVVYFLATISMQKI